MLFSQIIPPSSSPTEFNKEIRFFFLSLGKGVRNGNLLQWKFAWKIPWTEEPGRLQSWDHKELDTIEHAHTFLTGYMTLGKLFKFSQSRLKKKKEKPWKGWKSGI